MDCYIRYGQSLQVKPFFFFGSTHSRHERGMEMCGEVLLLGNLYWSNNRRTLPVSVGRGQLVPERWQSTPACHKECCISH